MTRGAVPPLSRKCVVVSLLFTANGIGYRVCGKLPVYAELPTAGTLNARGYLGRNCLRGACVRFTYRMLPMRARYSGTTLIHIDSYRVQYTLDAGRRMNRLLEGRIARILTPEPGIILGNYKICQRPSTIKKRTCPSYSNG